MNRECPHAEHEWSYTTKIPMKTISRLLLASSACLLFTQQGSAISIKVSEDSTTRLNFTLDWSSASPSSAYYTTRSTVIARVSGSSPTGHTGVYVEVAYYTGGLMVGDTFWIDSFGTTSLTAPYSLLSFGGTSTTFSKGSSTSASFVYGGPAAIMLSDLIALVADFGLSPADGNALGSLLEDAKEAMAAAAAAEPADIAHLLAAARDSPRDFNDRVKELVKAGTLTRDEGEVLTAAAKQVAASMRR